jgi:hypothetical protein
VSLAIHSYFGYLYVNEPLNVGWKSFVLSRWRACYASLVVRQDKRVLRYVNGHWMLVRKALPKLAKGVVGCRSKINNTSGCDTAIFIMSLLGCKGVTVVEQSAN